MRKRTSLTPHLERAFDLILQRPWAVLALVAAVTLVFALQLPRLSFSTSIHDLIIEDLPENTRYKEFKDVFGSDEIIRVVVKTDDVFDPETFARIAALSDALAGVAGVRRVISLATVRAAVDIGGRWPLDKFAAVIRPVRLFERNLLSADGRTAAMTLVLMPAPSGPACRSAGPGRLDRILDGVVRVVRHHQRPAMIGFVVLAVFCLMGVFRLQVETNPMGYFKADIPISRHFREIYQDLSGAFPANVVMGGGRPDFFEEPANLKTLDRVQRYPETLPGVDKTISLADYMRLVNYAGNGFDPAYYTLPEEGWELRMLYNSFKTMLGEDILARFVTSDLASANLLMLTHLSSSRDFIQLRRRIGRFLSSEFPEDLSWEVTGFGVVIAASSHLLTRGQIKSLGLTMVVVFAIMFTLFLSSKVGLIALVPNLFPILVNFGVMGWLGIELSMFTSLIASIAIGLAVDDTIHYMVRYNREFRQDLDDERALHATLHRLGRPIVFTTVTVSLGFSILTLSSFQPTAVFGLTL